jgi:hypothetical protein
MRPLAHHLGEDSLVNLLLVGGAGLSLIVVEGRARLAAARARLTRRVRGPAQRPPDGRRKVSYSATGVEVTLRRPQPFGRPLRLGWPSWSRGPRNSASRGLIIPLIIQTIRRDPSGSDQIDRPSNVSSPDRSGADQTDAEHQATDLVPARSAVAPQGCAGGVAADGCCLGWSSCDTACLIVPARTHPLTSRAA